MAISRYDDDTLVKEGRLLATNTAIVRLRDAISAGNIGVVVKVAKKTERLDIMAHQLYGDGRLWWIIAIASGIGWWPQVPPGTRLVVPVDAGQVAGVL